MNRFRIFDADKERIIGDSLFLLREYDEHFATDSQVVLGLFTTKEKALEEMTKRYDSRFEFSPNGDNQWRIEKRVSFYCQDCGYDDYSIKDLGYECSLCGGEIIADTEVVGGFALTEITVNQLEEV